METKQSIHVISEAKSVFDVLKTHGLAEGKIFILADSNTSNHCVPLIQEHLPGGGRSAILLNVPEGESSKTLRTTTELYNRLLEYGADRHSLILNVGGGMICDLGGYVGSTFKRGMPVINMPTTVLAQVDAALGGKTGVNHMGLKNMIGTFKMPLDTLVFPDFLNTLPKREVISGFAEMIKHALIASPVLWKAMLATPYIDLPFIKGHISPAMQVKNDIVAQDFEEHGVRKKLNFGHTIGHALESYMMESADRDLLHGEAVALGMIAESYISHKQGYLDADALTEISSFIAENYEGLQTHESEFHRLIEIMRHDKKNAGERLNMTLLKGIGDAVIDQEPTMEMIIDSLNYLMKYPFSK